MAIKVFGKPESEDVLRQLIMSSNNVADYGVLCADNHKGYSQPIGAALAFKDRISVTGVGFDIACGNKAVKTNIKASDIDISMIMDEIWKTISFGIGRKNDEKVDHEVLEKIANHEIKFIKDLYKKASQQLGTVGGGNHYVDLFKDNQDFLWVGVHFGSRGFGHSIANAFISASQGKSFREQPNPEQMMSLASTLGIDTPTGQAYIEAMTLAGEYAYAGRSWVVDKVLNILKANSTFEVHNHHNFAWLEKHFGQNYWVVRKGCTPAFPDQYGFVGGSMGDISVILKGIDSKSSQSGLYSTVHGAGRVMSRSKAVGKTSWEKRNGKRVRVNLGNGEVNFEKVKKDLKGKIELRGGGADEAPQVYKDLTNVLKEHEDTIEIEYVLTPIGVAMASNEDFDPYKG